MQAWARVATAVSIIGALAVANMQAWGYWFFLMGAAVWLVVAISRKDKELIATNLAFTIVNVWGLVAWS